MTAKIDVEFVKEDNNIKIVKTISDTLTVDGLKAFLPRKRAELASLYTELNEIKRKMADERNTPFKNQKEFDHFSKCIEYVGQHKEFETMKERAKLLETAIASVNEEIKKIEEIV